MAKRLQIGAGISNRGSRDLSWVRNYKLVQNNKVFNFDFHELLFEYFE